MCRWAAYRGEPLYLEELVSSPAHSLIEQSHCATRAKTATNGDGFGIAWYGDRPEPGRYRDILPAWSDCNLRSIARQIRSPLFLAHVRAATTGATRRDNCHPFVHGHWSFMHNGQVGGFETFRKQADMCIPDALYRHRKGATDSEVLFLLAPLLTATLALTGWVVVPFSPGLVIANINLGILYLLAISSLGVYGVIIGGWASNSKYPFLGSLRAAAQMVSYEVSIGFVIITVLLCVGSLNLTHIVLAQETGIGTWLGLPASFLDWHWLGLFPMFIVFFISALAETNRPPFDLVEAESELVAGHMIEYSSTPFLLFFLGEYVAIVLMCALTTILFLGGWLPPFDAAPFTWLPGIVYG